MVSVPQGFVCGFPLLQCIITLRSSLSLLIGAPGDQLVTLGKPSTNAGCRTAFWVWRSTIAALFKSSKENSDLLTLNPRGFFPLFVCFGSGCVAYLVSRWKLGIWFQISLRVMHNNSKTSWRSGNRDWGDTGPVIFDCSYFKITHCPRWYSLPTLCLEEFWGLEWNTCWGQSYILGYWVAHGTKRFAATAYCCCFN